MAPSESIIERYETLRSLVLSSFQRGYAGLGLDLLQRQGFVSWARNQAQTTLASSTPITAFNEPHDHFEDQLKAILTELALRTLPMEASV